MMLTSSPSDPLFFLHHCNIDRLWAQWQTQNAGQNFAPASGGPQGHNLNDLMYPWDGTTTTLSARPADVLNISALSYDYA
jgi:tyrosinase